MELPEGYVAEELLKVAIQEGVAFVPGASFYADAVKTNTLRLNFTHANEQQMTAGIQRFTSALEKFEASLTKTV